MDFEADDLDWAMGELLHLFAHANRVGYYPHELKPALFYAAWSVLNAQPFEVAQRCHAILMSTITRPLWHLADTPSVKRYANPRPH